MLTVLYVGNFRPAHSTENEVRKALEHLGHRVVQAQEDTIDFRALGDLAAAAGADLVLWTRTWHLDVDAQLEGLAKVRAAGIPSVSYHLDRWAGLDRQHQLHDEPFFRTDLVVTADGGHPDVFTAAGIDHVWMPPAVSEFECAPGRYRHQWRADVAFVGSWRHYHAEWPHRMELIDWLRRTYGSRFRAWPAAGQHAVRGQHLRDLYASVKVLVGDSCLVPDPDGAPATRYWSDRVPETLGRGGFLVHPWVDGMYEHFTPGLHFLDWPLGDWDSLKLAIDSAVADDTTRREIAAAGREHVLVHHTYTVRMRQLIELLTGRGML